MDWPALASRGDRRESRGWKGRHVPPSMVGRPLLADSAGALLRNDDHSDRADVRFARLNIQIYDAHVVDLYQWVCARISLV